MISYESRDTYLSRTRFECTAVYELGTLTPDQKGFVQIAVDTTSVTIKHNGTPMGAMLIFYNN